MINKHLSRTGLGLGLGIFLLVFLATAPQTLAYWHLNTKGQLEFKVARVLGDNEDAKQQAEQIRESNKQALETTREAQKNMAELLKDTNGQLKKDDKLEFKHSDAGVDIKIKSADGQEKEVEPQDEFTFEDVNDKGEVSIATEDGHLKLAKHGVEAKTDLNLVLSPKNNSLEVTLPGGTSKGIPVLPDQAVESVAAGATQSATVQLGLVGTEPTYTVRTELDKRLLGLFPVKIQRTSTVSAVSGLSQTLPADLYNRLLQLLSF